MTLAEFSYGWLATACLILVILLKVKAPYGRHAVGHWGPSVSNRVGWIIMELPALLVMLAFLFLADLATWGGLILMVLYAVHYVHRSLIYPFRIHTLGKQMPAVIVASAVVFNLVNATLLGFYLTSSQKFIPLVFWTGTVLFLTGEAVNLWSDRRLIALRSAGTGYFVPHGGLFEYVSCPNYLGEVIAWIGFAVASQNLGGLSFAVWTVANLLPRALAHHRWYRTTFPDYPSARKAMIPGIL